MRQGHNMDTPIKVAIFGGTGQTGSLIVDGLLASNTNFVSGYTDNAVRKELTR